MNRSVSSLVARVYVQMLPATLVAPAVRPLFAAHHGGNVSAMHAFMSLNMLGAAIAAPLLGARVDRAARTRALFVGLTLLDAALLALLAAPVPTRVLLALRFVEGGAHVGAATLLLARAAALAASERSGRVMALAGAAIIAAVASGSALGGALVGIDARAPFLVAAALALSVAASAVLDRATGTTLLATARASIPPASAALARALLVPASAAFVSRFTIGCLVVTFALFAHRVHGLSDGRIGWLFTAMTAPFALATFPVGRVLDRVAAPRVLAAGALVYAGVLFALGHVTTSALAPLMTLGGVASAMIFASLLHIATKVSREGGRGRAMGIVNAASCAGMIAGPTLAGIICAIAARAGDPVAGYRGAFTLAGASLVTWLVLSSRWLLTHDSVAVCPVRPAADLGRAIR